MNRDNQRTDIIVHRLRKTIDENTGDQRGGEVNNNEWEDMDEEYYLKEQEVLL